MKRKDNLNYNSIHLYFIARYGAVWHNMVWCGVAKCRDLYHRNWTLVRGRATERKRPGYVNEDTCSEESKTSDFGHLGTI